jgi:hypothetical protein
VTQARQIADWLEKLGMPEYAERFAENDIDFTILPELTDQDLEKIGVASLGHRRKILKAIAALSGPTPPSLATVASRPDAPQPRPAAAPVAAAPTAEPPYHCDVLRPRGFDRHIGGT